MALLKYIVVVLAVIVLAVKQHEWFGPAKLPMLVDGSVDDERFQPVLDAFRQNFVDGWEHEGAALAIYHNDKLVVDVWGGYADDAAQRPWNRDTLTVAFSTTKAMGALCIAKLVDEGRLKYTDLVTSFWPEFGQNGKENITVQMILNHQSGLAVIDEPVTLEDALSFKAMSKRLEMQKPSWPPGTDIGYHAITLGWLMEQIVRRVDKNHRFIGAYFRDEVMEKTGSEEFYIGLPKEHCWRVARQSYADIYDTISHMWDDWLFAKIMATVTLWPGPLFTKAFVNPSWLLGPYNRNGFNNPDVHRLPLASATGVGTARGLAQPFNALANGRFLSKETISQFAQPDVVGQTDLVIGNELNVAKGFFFRKSPQGAWLLGHPGFGGQQVRADFGNKLVFAYLTNGLKAGLGDNSRTYKRIQQALYGVIRNM